MAWKCNEEIELHALENGFYMFKFRTYESQKILEDGPWFGGQLLVLRRWLDNMDLQKADMKTIPIWVKFLNLKLSCRSVNILSKISC